MSKKLDLLIIVIGLFVVYLAFHFHPLTKSLATNTPQKEQQAHSKVTDAKTTKTKTTMEMSDPLLDCSSEADLCEKAILPSKQEFSYSDYIWADQGETITFQGTSLGADEIDVWVENEDGSYSSNIGVIPSNETKTFTVTVPLEGNYRLVMQNKSADFIGSGTGYIEDAWSD